MVYLLFALFSITFLLFCLFTLLLVFILHSKYNIRTFHNVCLCIYIQACMYYVHTCRFFFVYLFVYTFICICIHVVSSFIYMMSFLSSDFVIFIYLFMQVFIHSGDCSAFFLSFVGFISYPCKVVCFQCFLFLHLLLFHYICIYTYLLLFYP